MLLSSYKLFSLLPMTIAFGQGVKALNLFRGPSQQDVKRWAGVNLAGLEFGMQNTGTMNQDPMEPPPISQIQHFRAENVTAFRIPISWQRMQPKIMGPLDPDSLQLLSKYVNSALACKASVIIDLHNYARRDGKVIGEAEDLPASLLVDFWTRIAQKFGEFPEVGFGIMNEPHDVKLDIWIETLQAVVTAIRKTGATNKIILPADNWSHLQTFATSYNAGMSKIHNPDGSCTGLIFEIHQYFDSDGSGTSAGCPVPHTKELQEVVTLLAKDDRQAMITEFGGGHNPDCPSVLADFVEEAHKSFPQILGYFLWGAGAFHQDYTLVVTVEKDGEWVDQSNFLAIQKFMDPGPKRNQIGWMH
ncbi:uncharacterized protein PGTG_18155 [Puccinia graminis f. sp. tritici CRL 75-36-700-3]|uniref:cellulase n=1 Tax=Puccinia graminis f. sp. tritici (strain CRL 75-36-700-3 / race SCCL) TaxID=418459 RepID=E3L690_PUCGT|nr:uncharacterized protein PGTG_18155 [Puccinia graminis f. sp. tritici CRL 75-36-700-3]EFP92065.2 hypothetical protein PGTG_18155 [Puccinia graminis f. sp. tritici CRL 75-36-700-3]